MDTITNLIRESLLTKSGVIKKIAPSFEQIKEVQCPQDLFIAADNRMIQGYFRYSWIFNCLGKFDFLKELENRIKLYKQTKNREYLADAINMLRLQNEYGKLKGEVFESVDDGYHAKEK